jgi:hypothetical protein
MNENCNLSITHYGRDYHKPICPKCGSGKIGAGAGRKPNEMSLKCSECKAFIGYRNLEKLKRRRRQKRLTQCLEILEEQNLSGDLAIFTLSLAADGGEA